MTPEREAALNKALDEYEALVRDAGRYRKLREGGIVTLLNELVAGAGLDEYVDELEEISRD